MSVGSPSTATLRLGLRENLGQFALLVVVNAFVGAMVSSSCLGWRRPWVAHARAPYS